MFCQYFEFSSWAILICYKRVHTLHTDLSDCLSSLFKDPYRRLLEKVSSSSFVNMVFLSPGQFLIYSYVVVSSTTPLTNPTTYSPGILVVGSFSPGSAYQSVEFCSPSDPEEGSCQLNDYPRQMDAGPTANLVSGQL